MRLTKLELKGFKSFADKTVVNFDNDITGIVGPNGCGKSNVVDAIRWVLGEQRAKTLRLEKMDNIIFNGTKDRKASNLAEVSLTFDNTKNIIPTEFSHVTITRTIYRTGESEYKINGVSCRLKDIKNLFMDTGIGSSTYAIMELKMIDDVLNDVDNSRRTLIEQAAGISKYKARKHETLLKLKGTEADLDRVEDLLFEINNNMKELESQARKANRFKKLKEKYKDLSVNLAKYDMLFIHDKYEAIGKDEAGLTDQKTALEADIQKREAALQKLKKDILEREKSLSTQQKGLNEFMNSIQERESDRKVANQKVEFLGNRIEVLGGELVALANEEKSLKEEIELLSSKIKEEETNIKSFRDEVSVAKEQLEEKRSANLTIKESLESHRMDFHNLRNQLNESEKMLAIRESKMESLRNSIQRSLFEREERLESVRILEVTIGKLAGQVEKQQALISDLEVEEEGNEKKIARLESGIEKHRNTLIETRRDLDAKSNELRLTRNMVDSLEGFPESIKYLKKQADWLKDTSLLSDVLYCEEQYRIPLELALKPWLNHFVVQTTDEATKAIELLSSSKKGRSNFFILDDFKVLKAGTKPKKQKGLIPAYDIVEVDKQYHALFEFLLRNVYFVEQGVLGSPVPDAEAVLVDLKGGWIRSSVELSGGTVGLFEGKRLGRLKNLEKLGKDIEKLKSTVQGGDLKLKKDQAELVHLKNNSYRRTIDRERQELQKLERELVTNQSRIENFKEFVDSQSKHHLEVEGNIKAIKGEISVLKVKFEEATKATDIKQHKLDALESDFKAASIEFSHFQDQFQEKNILYIQNENAIQSYKQTRSFKQSRVETVKVDSEKDNKELEFSKSEIETIRKGLVGMEEALIDLYKQADVKKHDLTGHENSYYELKEGVQEEEDTIRKKYRQKEEVDTGLLQNKEKKSNLKFELQSLRQRLSLEFKVDVEAMLEELEAPGMDRTELEMKLDSISRKIENFGEVNPMAETAYDEMKKRFDFITEQKQDLIDAKESLLETIHEIETTAKEHFMDSFMAIRENFKNVFRSMFSEHDNCDLILLNPEKPLESKVEIIAKPKGKRPQSINQLSGGEKSLTSLSLLFALYLYKPAPFCILDEVDAPLDDANVNKFNNAIQTFAKESQFIVVTHNKQTMAAVDSVYGVTMHKAGISMLVPADFKSFKDTEAVAS
ncbi:MAG: chromosome segregation protein SMC [Bacteroidetes bacterium]|nr:chromosome segregation protein SMC [Bacteroidota bacterium]